MNVKKAIFPVAGLGTRFLPATKANPKEMLPIVDKPLIQYAVEEAVAAGITELVFVTGRNKRAIADHFDVSLELETQLEAQNKQDLLKSIRNIVPKHVTCVYIRQPEALGLGHAILCARSVIGDEPSAVLLADDIIDSNGKGCMGEMVNAYAEHHCSIIGVEQINKEEISSYGVISPKSSDQAEIDAADLIAINDIVEKPSPEDAPSNYAVVGRYILTPAIFEILAEQPPGRGGEIQLTDGIARLLESETVMARKIPGVRYDCGSKLGYLEATLKLGLRHPEVGEQFRQLLVALATEITTK